MRSSGSENPHMANVRPPDGRPMWLSASAVKMYVWRILPTGLYLGMLFPLGVLINRVGSANDRYNIFGVAFGMKDSVAYFTLIPALLIVAFAVFAVLDSARSMRAKPYVIAPVLCWLASAFTLIFCALSLALSFAQSSRSSLGEPSAYALSDRPAWFIGLFSVTLLAYSSHVLYRHARRLLTVDEQQRQSLRRPPWWACFLIGAAPTVCLAAYAWSAHLAASR